MTHCVRAISYVLAHVIFESLFVCLWRKDEYPRSQLSIMCIIFCALTVSKVFNFFWIEIFK
jgi:hypothetical protein